MIKFRNENYGVETILKGGNDLAKVLCGEGDTADFTGITNITNEMSLKNVKKIILGDTIENIGDKFIYENYIVDTIDCSDCYKLETIGNNVFDKCSNVKYLDLRGMKNVTSIGSYFLQGCTDLEQIDVNFEKLTSVGYDFLTGSKITSFTMTDCTNLERINNYFLYHNLRLEYVDMSDCINLKTIDGRFLESCDNLQYVKLGATIPPSMYYYLGFQTSVSIYVPDESVDAYKTAPYWSNRADQIKPMSEAPQI